MTLFTSVAVALACGVLLTRITKIFNLPDVTGYLIAGLLIGPFFLGRLGIPGLGFTSYEYIDSLSLFSNLALGFIAFSIGSEFKKEKLKVIGKQAVVIAIFEGLCAAVFVGVALAVVHMVIPDKLSLPAAICLAAIASATAPAATLMVVNQFKAKGPVTDILLPVVALDDAVALICFAVASGVARGMRGGDADIISMALIPAAEIILSLVLGAVMGLVLLFFEQTFHSNRNRMILVVSIVMLTIALSMMEINIAGYSLTCSSLLVCMMLGLVFCNTCPLADDLLDKAGKWTAPLYCLFFVLSGAELELEIFSDFTIIVIGIVYILARSLGKYFGAGASSKMMKCDPKVTKYLGITLLPQAGVALGMSLTAAEILGEDGALIRTIVLFGVLVYELIGPTLTKIALTKAGDIVPKSDDVKNRRGKMIAQAGKSENLK